MSIRNPRKVGMDKRDDGSQSAQADLPWAAFTQIFLALMLLLLCINPRVPPIAPEDSALYITAEWDEGLVDRVNALGDRNTSRQSVLQRAGVPLQVGHSTADVDLWTAYVSPDGRRCEVVGYPGNLRQSSLLKLDQDDLGWAARDAKNDLRREVVGARARHLPEGTYIASVHLFSPRGEQVSVDHPIVVRLRITVNQGRPGMSNHIVDVPMTRQGQEMGIEFRIDDKGNLVDGSMTYEASEDFRIATRGRLSHCRVN